MKSYVPVLLGLSLVGAYAMEDDRIVYARVAYYNPGSMQIADHISVAITQNTSFYDMQDEIRRSLGAGDLKIGSMKIGERGEGFYDIPFSKRYDSLEAARKVIESLYFFDLRR